MSFNELKIKQEWEIQDEYNFKLTRQEQMTLAQLVGIVIVMAFLLVLLFLSAVV